MGTNARRIWQLIEPLHAVTYFSPEAIDALAGAGYRGFWMGYFAGRAAPLGAVGPEVVHAAFYNFDADRVARALPSAWEFAAPSAALEARLAGATRALRRQLGEFAGGPAVAQAAALLRRAVCEAPAEGRILFAANLALPEPGDDLGRVWQAATALREHRGDAHNAALMTAGVGGRESHVLHSLAHGTPHSVYRTARGLEDDEWALITDNLRERGWVSDEGDLTDLGRSRAHDVERRTDDLATTAYSSLSETEIDQLETLLAPLASAVVRAGDIPVDSPMGLDLRQVAD